MPPETNQPASRQVLYQRMHREQGLCIICNTPATPKWGQPGTTSCYCIEHKEAHRERARRRIGAQRRKRRSSSYALPRKLVHYDPGDGQRTPCGGGTKFSCDWNQVTCEKCFMAKMEPKPQ